MEVLHEYALLFAVALPVVLVVGMNLVLALTGERGTLLLPFPRPMPSTGPAPVDVQPAAALPVQGTRAASPVNDVREREREAA